MRVDPSCCVVIGDKASDTQAAHNAGAQSILVEDARGIIEAIESLLERMRTASGAYRPSRLRRANRLLQSRSRTHGVRPCVWECERLR